MRCLRKYSRLAPAERRLLLRATALVAAIRAVLWLLPYSTLRSRLTSQSSRATLTDGASPQELVWAVRAASRRIPGATCLTQSLALQHLFARAGQQAQVHIGVAKQDDSFEAHAWVEHRGETFLNTAQEIAHYRRIATWEAVSR